MATLRRLLSINVLATEQGGGRGTQKVEHLLSIHRALSSNLLQHTSKMSKQNYVEGYL